MTAHYSDETLMAFADGMLDEPMFSAVAEAVDGDPALAARLEQLVDGAALCDGHQPGARLRRNWKHPSRP